MRTLTLALAAATGLTLWAGGASAQPYGDWFGGSNWRDPYGQWVSMERRKIQLDRRIERGLRNGQLTPREAARLRDDFDDIARIEHRYRRNGLSRWEMADLDRRFDRLALRIRWERRDDQRRYGYSRW